MVSAMRRLRNVFIYMSSEADFMKALSREACDIDGVIYRVFQWTPKFSKDEEPSLVPIWIVLPSLPPNFYHESLLRTLTTKFTTKPPTLNSCCRENKLILIKVLLERNRKKLALNLP